jgi:fatty acid desaturase
MPMARTMVPDHALLVPPDPNGHVLPDGRLDPVLRAQLRRIPSWRNAGSVALVWAETIAIATVALWWNHPVGWVLAFVLMGRQHARFNILMHEAAHRLLLRNRVLNDFVGRWFLGFPALAPVDLYRRGHMAHHREEFGPGEPDIPLYAGYPIGRDSMRRKLTRDALGITGLKILRGLVRGLVASNGRIRAQAWSIVGVQVALLALCWLLGHPWVYLVLWFLPYLTVWRVINRLRAIAEHGGMQRSRDRRETTHAVRQSPLARFWMVPYNTGWHLAHHVDAGVPWRNLPAFHRELVRSGYVQPTLEYPNYRALWRRLASGGSVADDDAGDSDQFTSGLTSEPATD